MKIMPSCLLVVPLVSTVACGVTLDEGDDHEYTSQALLVHFCAPTPSSTTPTPTPTSPPSSGGTGGGGCTAVARNPPPVPATCSQAGAGVTGAEFLERDATWVWTSDHLVAPDRARDCDRPYLGASTCGWFRIVTHDLASPVFGPWTRSCSTPEALEPSLQRLRPGQEFSIEQNSRTDDPMATQFTFYM
jgi:hypothetical protein